MDQNFIDRIYREHKETAVIPSSETICRLTNGILEMLFPVMSERRYKQRNDFNDHFMSLQFAFQEIVRYMQPELGRKANEIADQFFKSIPEIYYALDKDADAILAGDPAAQTKNEVVRTYPGFFAIAIYRLAHKLCQLNVNLIPRILTEYAHEKTGIEIHPGATIGESFCIDHGTGIVIGETTSIGRNVKVYQGVTLGALSVAKEMAKTKRHPTIEDDVVIYAGATILGGETVIGNGSIIGGNVWLTKSVSKNSQVYHRGEIKITQSED